MNAPYHVYHVKFMPSFEWMLAISSKFSFIDNMMEYIIGSLKIKSVDLPPLAQIFESFSEIICRQRQGMCVGEKIWKKAVAMAAAMTAAALNHTFALIYIVYNYERLVEYSCFHEKENHIREPLFLAFQCDSQFL